MKDTGYNRFSSRTRNSIEIRNNKVKHNLRQQKICNIFGKVFDSEFDRK